jgi:L-alanine-DL-glutamate epimerase-like enolase superfamily enzyme
VVGGLTETRRVAALGARALAAHRTARVGSALLWASLQLAAATPNCMVFGFCQAYYQLLYDLVTTPWRWTPTAMSTVPTEPGLGVELQPEQERVRSRVPEVRAHTPGSAGLIDPGACQSGR